MKNVSSEKAFEMTWITQNPLGFVKCFPIETEETMAGFPDVLCIDRTNRVVLVEMKVLSNAGTVHFQPAQIAFYKRNADLPIVIAIRMLNESVRYFASNVVLKVAKKNCSSVLSLKALEKVVANESDDSEC